MDISWRLPTAFGSLPVTPEILSQGLVLRGPVKWRRKVIDDLIQQSGASGAGAVVLGTGAVTSVPGVDDPLEGYLQRTRLAIKKRFNIDDASLSRLDNGAYHAVMMALPETLAWVLKTMFEQMHRGTVADVWMLKALRLADICPYVYDVSTDGKVPASLRDGVAALHRAFDLDAITRFAYGVTSTSDAAAVAPSASGHGVRTVRWEDAEDEDLDDADESGFMISTATEDEPGSLGDHLPSQDTTSYGMEQAHIKALAYCRSIPGFNEEKARKGAEQSSTTQDQHGYVKTIWSTVIDRLATAALTEISRHKGDTEAVRQEHSNVARAWINGEVKVSFIELRPGMVDSEVSFNAALSTLVNTAEVGYANNSGLAVPCLVIIDGVATEHLAPDTVGMLQAAGFSVIIGTDSDAEWPTVHGTMTPAAICIGRM